MKRLKLGRVYKIKDAHGYEGYGVYMGRQAGWECVICNCGNNCKTFNILHGSTIEEGLTNKDRGDYETYGYGPEHFPDLEDTGVDE